MEPLQNSLLEAAKKSVTKKLTSSSDMELLMAHVDFESFIKVVDLFRPSEQQGASIKQCISQEDCKEKGEMNDSRVREPVSALKLNSGVRYGTVLDLLCFINLLSDIQCGSFIHFNEETGVLLNKADLAVKGGRYRINSDVFLFPWKLTFQNPGSGYIPKGSFGRVQLAQDTETGKQMACKQIPLEDFRASEVEIQAGLRHENIAELYGAVLWDDTIHLFMEVGEGGSVLEKLDCCGPMSEHEIIWVTGQILKGLDYLHCHKVIHHDIKPSNIVLKSSKAILVDFGLSVKMTGDVYYPKDFRGTEIYMSPEVVLCRGHTTKADIYSLGATIIHMQTGHPPWVRRYPPLAYPSYLYIIHKQAPPLQDIGEDCSRAMRSFLSRSLDQNPDVRASAAELLWDEVLHLQQAEQP